MELLAGEELYAEGVEEDVLYTVAEGLLQSFHSLQGTDETLRIDCASGFNWAKTVLWEDNLPSSVKAVRCNSFRLSW